MPDRDRAIVLGGFRKELWISVSCFSGKFGWHQQNRVVIEN